MPYLNTFSPEDPAKELSSLEQIYDIASRIVYTDSYARVCVSRVIVPGLNINVIAPGDGIQFDRSAAICTREDFPGHEDSRLERKPSTLGQVTPGLFRLLVFFPHEVD